MSAELRDLIAARIRARGPLTVAEYMELALYHPALGYYARASRRSGRAGDFFTSVDMGPIFGELLAVQFAEMWRLLKGSGVFFTQSPAPDESANEKDSRPLVFDLVEVAAGDGRLARDVLDAATADPDFYGAIALHLVERSAAARARHADVLGAHASKLVASSSTLPDEMTGVIVANELLDALPTHVVVMTRDGLQEVFVDLNGGGALVERPGTLSRPELAAYLGRLGVRLQPGWRAEINLAAVDWVREAASRLRRGFLMLIDYGHRAEELYSAGHASGTLTSFRGHTAGAAVTDWLADPGNCDLTAHVDFTSIEQAARAEGLETLAHLDQTYFVLGLGLAERPKGAVPLFSQASTEKGVRPLFDLKRRLALKTLMLPGGLGSTHKVLILGKGVGRPTLRCCAAGARLT